MNKLEITKIATSVIVGAVASKAVSKLIKEDNPEDNFVTHVMKSSTSSVVGMIVADKTKKYTDAKIDQIAAWYHEKRKK